MGEFLPGEFSGTQLEWFYQLERTNIRDWEDLAAAFYKEYQYNADLAQLVHNYKICPWARMKGSKNMPKSGEI